MATIRKRRTKDGDLRYQVQVRMRGYRPESASFERLTDARKWEQQTEAAMREGRHFQSSQAKKHTLSEAIERYQRDVLPDTRKTAEDVEQHLRWWNHEIGRRVLADVTPALITQRRDKLRSSNTPQGSRRSGSTVNRYLQSLSHVFSIAEREWEWIARNPRRTPLLHERSCRCLVPCIQTSGNAASASPHPAVCLGAVRHCHIHPTSMAQRPSAN